MILGFGSDDFGSIPCRLICMTCIFSSTSRSVLGIT